MRELREFRVAHAEYVESGLEVAGITRDSPESNLEWSQRLQLPFPLLSDVDHETGRAFQVVRRIGIGDWGIEFFRRTTFLIDRDGVIAAVWGNVKVRGHAAQVLAAARALASVSPGGIGRGRPA